MEKAKKIIKKKTGKSPTSPKFRGMKPKASKKATLKLKSKKPVAKKRSVRMGVKEKKDLNSEIIFDSRVGNTGALFVDEPQSAPVVQAPVETPELKIPELFPDTMLDPDLNNSLKEFDAIQKGASAPVQPQKPEEQKKKWWQRLFKM